MTLIRFVSPFDQNFYRYLIQDNQIKAKLQNNALKFYYSLRTKFNQVNTILAFVLWLVVAKVIDETFESFGLGCDF